MIAVAGSQFVKEGCWDSIHIVEAIDGETAGKTTYKLTTTVMLHMAVEKVEVGNTSLSGSLTRQVNLLEMSVCLHKIEVAKSIYSASV